MMPGMSNPVVGAGEKSAAFMGLVAENASISFGAAHPTRRIVAVVHWGEASFHSAMTSATIAGIPATIHVQTGHSGGLTGFGVAIVSAAVPTGTDGVISATFAGNGENNVSCGVYRLVGLDSGVPTDVDSDQSVSRTADVSVTVAVLPAGIVVGGFSGSTNATSPVTWTGVEEQYDLEDSVHKSSGFVSRLPAQNRVVTADITPQSNSGNGLVVASWS